MVKVLDHTKEYNDIWDKVHSFLGFRPSCKYRGHSLCVELPFKIHGPYVVYAIDEMNDSEDAMDELVRNCLINCAKDREWYALDWQHSAFRFHPCNVDEMNSVWVEQENTLGGGYYAYFPSFYPDGDYYFFIDSEFENGYLGHPWRQEVWIFGTSLIDEVKKIADILNWKEVHKVESK